MRWRCVEEAAHNYAQSHTCTRADLLCSASRDTARRECRRLCLTRLVSGCTHSLLLQAHSLGLCLWMGEGTLVDLEEAKVWLAKSADQGVVMAAESLELLIQEQARETRV